MDALWNEIASTVESGREGPKIDLKGEITLDVKGDRAEFAKDVSAIANTSGGTGYIVIGVVDAKDRAGNNPEDYIKGFCHHNVDNLEQQMQQALSNYVEPPPIFEFQTIIHPEVNRIFGVVIIHESSHRPHLFIRDSGTIKQGDIFVRRSSHTCKACRSDILQMMDDYCQSKVDEEKEFMRSYYRGLDRESTDWQHIAEQACKKLYTKFEKHRREKVVRDILSQFGKQDYFERWFADS